MSNLLVNVFVRNLDKDKQLMEEVKNAGGKVIQGDATNPDTIIGCTKGIHTIVSALVGDFKTVVDGQLLFLEDGIKNGVKRFVPAEFGPDVWNNVPKGEHYFTDQRLIFREKLSLSSIPGLHFTNGNFMEAFYNHNKEKFTYWGSPDTEFDLTSQEDAAKYLAAAIAKPDRIGDLKVVGQTLTITQARDIYNKVTGKNLELVKGGSVEDLQNRIHDAKLKKNWSEAIALGYGLLTWSGKGQIKVKMNNEFPEIQPLTWENFIKKHKEISYVSFVYNLPKCVEEELKTYNFGPSQNITN